MNNLHNLFDSLQEFDLGNGHQGSFYSLRALEKAGVGSISRLPFQFGWCWNPSSVIATGTKYLKAT